MANTQSQNWLQSQRVDTTHLKMIDSGVVFDFQTLLQGFVHDSPYVVNGFYIPSAANYINAQASTIQIVVADSVAWMPGQAAGSFVVVPSTQPNEVLNSSNSNVVGSFTPGTVNYVAVQLIRQTDSSTNDIVSFWDVDAKSEFTKTVPLGLVLKYQIVINTSGFGSGSSELLPIAIVNVNSSGAVTSIENAKQSPWRLGSGGASPNPYASYTLAAENPIIVTANGQPDPFLTGDFTLGAFIDWAQIVMSRLLSLGGGSLWYVNGSSLIPNINVSDLAFNAEYSVMTGVGSFTHDPTTAGHLEWSSPLFVRSIFGNLTFTIDQGSVQLADTQVGYITLVRNQNFQPTNSFTFANGSNTVTAANTISGIAAGDYIMYVNDTIGCYALVQTVSGSNITLATNYTGTSATGVALRCQGTYTTVSAANPTAVPVNGSTYWLAKRDDNAFIALTIDSPTNSGLVRTDNTTTVKTTTTNGLVYGQSIVITGASDSSFDGTFDIRTIVDGEHFTVFNPGPNVSGGTAGNGSISAVPKIYLRLRGGNGELQQGESAQIDDTTLANVLQFIGASSESDTSPPYSQFFVNTAPYQFSSSDSLTVAISAAVGNINDIYASLSAPGYEEPLAVIASGASGNNQINGPITAGTNITLPENSRLSYVPQYYTVGKGWLDIFLNGQYLPITLAGAVSGGWTEVGTPGNTSNVIQVNQNLDVGDVITFKIRMPGGPGSGAVVGDFNGLPADPTANNADFIPIYDVALSAYRKQSRGVFLSGISGSTTRTFTTYTSNHTLTSADDFVLVDCSSGPVTITLPAASTVGGERWTIKKKDATANAITVTAAANIDFSTTFTIPNPGDSADFTSDATQYWID